MDSRSLELRGLLAYDNVPHKPSISAPLTIRSRFIESPSGPAAKAMEETIIIGIIANNLQNIIEGSLLLKAMPVAMML